MISQFHTGITAEKQTIIDQLSALTCILVAFTVGRGECAVPVLSISSLRLLKSNNKDRHVDPTIFWGRDLDLSERPSNMRNSWCPWKLTTKCKENGPSCGTLASPVQGPSALTLAEWSVDIRDKDGEGVEKRRTGPGIGSQAMPPNRTLSLARCATKLRAVFVVMGPLGSLIVLLTN
jgi:hypothetical protein